MMSGRAVVIAAVTSGVVTAAVVVRPASRVLYGRPGLASPLETAAFAVVLLAYMAFGRLRRERTRSYLTLACGFTVICLPNLPFAVEPPLTGLAAAESDVLVGDHRPVIGRSAFRPGGFRAAGRVLEEEMPDDAIEK